MLLSEHSAESHPESNNTSSGKNCNGQRVGQVENGTLSLVVELWEMLVDATVYIGTEWLVGLGRAKLTVTPYTITRILFMERVARLHHQALTRSICRGSTAEVGMGVWGSARPTMCRRCCTRPICLFCLALPPWWCPGPPHLKTRPLCRIRCCGFAAAA